MTTSPLISVALCTYNGEQFIRDQIDSILNQTYSNIEIIAVDDQSTDSTFSILQEYQTRFKNLYVFQNETNLGFRKNFEEALGKCSGDYIALADQDDVWRKEKLALQINLIGDNSLIYHDSEFIDEKGISMNKKLSDVMTFYKGTCCHTFLLENCVSGHSCLFNSALISKIIPFPPDIYHDKWLAFVATSENGIDFIHQPLVGYRQHSESNTDVLRIKKMKRGDVLEKMKLVSEEMARFHSFLPNDLLIKKLDILMKTRLVKFFNWDLFILIFTNRKKLFYCKKKPFASILGYCVRYIWGYRLKRKLMLKHNSK